LPVVIGQRALDRTGGQAASGTLAIRCGTNHYHKYELRGFKVGDQGEWLHLPIISEVAIAVEVFDL